MVGVTTDRQLSRSSKQLYLAYKRKYILMSMITLPFEDTTMATSVVHSSVCFLVFFSMVALIPTSSGQYPSSTSGNCYPADTSGTSLTPNYYQFTCPGIFHIVRDIVQKAIDCDPRMGASLLRLHFHDCWVNGCDGSVLLVNRDNFVASQLLYGVVLIYIFNLVFVFIQLGGPCYQVLLGRKDSLTANKTTANTDLPSPFANITTLLANFAAKGFGLQELVPLSGAHTIGRARCGTFRKRLSSSDINPTFAAGLANNCTANAAAGGNFTVPFDNTTTVFDTVYYQMLTQQMGLLNSDQELWDGGDQTSANLVTTYSTNQAAFWADFSSAMIKMGNLPPSSSNGQIRCNCSIPNSYSDPPNSLLNLLPPFCPLTLFTCPSSPLGCDGSVLLIDIGNFIGEQSAIPNKNSLRGFDVVAQIKAELNSVCRCGNVVSCADILAIAARDSIEILEFTYTLAFVFFQLGGPRYKVLLGRLDSLTASFADAKTDLPSPFSNFTRLIANFVSHGFGLKDLVVLSGAHTIGRARCVTFRSRIYNDSDINSNFANGLETTCPANASLGGNNTAPFDATTNVFDTVYYRELTRQMGLLHSDQELYSGGNQTSADLVTKYSKNRAAFWKDFAVSIINMGNLPPASGNGQVRCNCSIVNNPSPPNNLGITASCPSSPASFFNPGTDPTHCPSPPTSSPNLGSP
ncbi:hypothetical protein RHSIM_Rhsim13G0062100 [Rhododendron simsii]|uniref:peroxidase n=1 Tax=Rhododendron simsii TaxID=118357 RepID=A0A834G1S0_RHOSS|nr:hypothetical protein RHSIM_Rhsim13G0062100 [Rhododendron simsii]